MKTAVFVAFTALLYAAHQDFWFWREAKPLVFGFLPIGLFYHVCCTIAASLLMWGLVKSAWPKQLEREAERPDSQEDARR